MLNRPLVRGAMLFGAVVALALPATGIADPKHDSVHGSGLNNPPPGTGPINRFNFEAQSDADGSNPKGHAEFRDITTRGEDVLRFRGDVQCLRVDGNIARLVIQVTRSTNAGIPVGRLWRIDVEDNGKNNHGESVDEIRNGPIATVDCSGFVAGDRTLTHGNIKVEDAS